MKELITYMARTLVDYPERVNVFEANSGHTSIYELKVAKEDLGKVIGREGRTANAMRTILYAVSSKHRKNSILEIIE
jgi:predicted RNA-binding protein YlqC (UPF0109 family)